MNASILRLVAFRFVAVLISLFVLTLPFPYHVLPDVGGWLRPCTEAFARWTCDHLLNIQPPYTAAIVSDSTGMYAHALNLLIISAMICILWSVLSRDGGGRVERSGGRVDRRNLFHAAASYYLALQLLEYGVDKLFKHQFGLPEPNTLYSPVGFLTRDILYWSTIGSSYSYNLIVGLLETITALLLLFRRTRLLGGLCAVAVMINIVIINFTFDISVKLYSCFLLLLSLIAAWPGLTRLFGLLILNRPADPLPIERKPRSTTRLLLFSLAKALLIVAILMEPLYPYFAAGNFNDDLAPRPFLHGAYDVECFVRNGDTLPASTGVHGRPRRIFIHRRGYFITQSMQESMMDYRLAYSTADSELILNANDGTEIQLRYTLSNNDSLLTLKGKWRGDSVAIRARRIDLARLPLFQGSFHWTIDEYR